MNKKILFYIFTFLLLLACGIFIKTLKAENAKRDANATPVMIGVDDNGTIRMVRVNNSGYLKVISK